MTNQKKKTAKAKCAECTLRKQKSRSKQSEEQKGYIREKNAESMRQKRDSETVEDREKNKKKNKLQKRRNRQTKKDKTGPNQMDEDEEYWSDEDNELLSDEAISKSTAEALKYLHQSHIKGTNLHQANVCVVCDCYIIGTEPVMRLNDKRLKPHNKRLGVEN